MIREENKQKSIIMDRDGRPMFIANADGKIEQIKPCVDCISREAVKEIVDYYIQFYDGQFHINEAIDKLPSVQPKEIYNKGWKGEQC